MDDMVGWDFLDDDNDPFDDVQYGHGTGEARDSSGEADNGGDIGACPNCMVIHMRVGDSFIADSNRFAQAAIYAADNGVDVIQEALGTLNNSSLSRAAVEYAYEHGVTVIASAADEAAQHHNWPSSLPHVILVNSIEKYDLALTPGEPLVPPVQRLHELLVQDHGRDPERELLLGCDRPRVRHGGADLQRGAERARSRRARPPPHLRAHRRRARA